MARRRRAPGLSAALPRNYRGMDADDILGVYPEKFRQCRVLGHNPRFVYRVLSVDPEGLPILRERVEVCRRCGRTRRFLLNRSYRRVSPHDNTHYPNAYGTPKSGLRKADFAAIEYEADFELALQEGRVIVDDGDVVE